MIYTIYVSQIQEVKEYLDLQNWQTEYSITSNPQLRIQSTNKIILYGLCLHLSSNIQRQQYIQIQDNYLRIRQQDRQKAVYFMNRAVSKSLTMITHQLQVKILMKYLRQQNKIYDIKMILKIEPDLQESTPVKRQKIYAIIYFHYEETEAIIENFMIDKILLNDQLIRNKIEFLGLHNSDDGLNQSGNGLWDQLWQQKKVNYRIMEYSQQNKNEISKSSSLMVMDQPSQSKTSFNLNSTININCQYLVVYGDRKYVQKFMFRIRQNIDDIKHKIFHSGDAFFNHFIFAIMKLIAENYQKCRVFELDKGKSLQMLYHSSIQNIFQDKFMKYSEYKTTNLSNVRYSLFRQPTIVQAKDTIPDLMVYSDKNDGQLVIGQGQLINHLQMVNEKLRKLKKVEKLQNKKTQNKNKQLSTPVKQQSSNKKQIKSQKDFQEIQKIKIDFMNNLQINETNYKELLQICQQFKMQQFMTFKIDINQCIRITNRIKKCNTIYVLFQNVVQLLQLQSVIDEPINLFQLQKVIKQYQQSFYHNPKIVFIQSSRITLKLYPFTQQIIQNKQKYFKQLLQIIKADSVIFKNLLTSFHIFKQIIKTCIIDQNLTFVLNQLTPLIQCDDQFDKQTQSSKIKTSKKQLQYYYHIKVDINNTDYRSVNNLRKQQNFLKQIMSKDIHQYQIGEYILNQVDQYNISYMIAEGMQSMFFILSSKPTQQYIYLTYFQKLVKVIRDGSGKFSQIQDATMSRDIDRNNQQVIRPVINRAFLTGQRYISINLPVDHVKSVKLNNITRLACGNHNLVRYYLKKLTQSERYKILVKPSCSSQYFEKRFAKQYILRFQNQQLRKQIKSLDLGYGNIKKWRQKPFVCMKADHLICQKVLKKFLSSYQPQVNQKKQKKL